MRAQSRSTRRTPSRGRAQPQNLRERVRRPFSRARRAQGPPPLSRSLMKKNISLAALALLVLSSAVAAKEARLVRYPHYHEGRVAFSYLGDVWAADEDGRNVQRLTVNRARDVYPRFSPDGKWIAFSSDRNGNLDVYLIPSAGGTVKQLTSHSADDTVLAWSPDSKRILFATNRAEDFTGKLYSVGLDGGMPQ